MDQAFHFHISPDDESQSPRDDDAMIHAAQALELLNNQAESGISQPYLGIDNHRYPGSGYYGHQIEGFSQQSQSGEVITFRSRRLNIEEEPPAPKRHSKPLNKRCGVCGDEAPDHTHYGATACFSCRAFFRRSVNRGNSSGWKEGKYFPFACTRERNPKEEDLCEITINTRRNCQHCRLRRCLKIGMKPSWVMSQFDKEERRSRTKARFGAAAKKDTVRSPIGVFTSEDHNLVQYWTTIDDSISSRFSLSYGVSNEIRFLRNGKDDKDFLSLGGFNELYDHFKSQIRLFIQELPDVKTIPSRDYDFLCHHNIDSMVIVRLLQAFSSSNGEASIETFNNSNALPITLKQVFYSFWSRIPNYTNYFFQTISRLADLMGKDFLLSKIFQVLCFFNTLELYLENSSKIEACREHLAFLLLRYLSSIGQPRKFPLLIDELFHLREISNLRNNCFG